MHVQKLDHSIRCSSYSRDNANQRRTSSKISPNDVYGRSCHDNGSQMLDESPPKKDLDEGIVEVVVAGVVLVAGLSVAALSLNNPVSGTKKTMETLITHQEESLSSADQNDDVESAGPKRENVLVDDDSYSHEKENEATTKDKLSHSIQQDLEKLSSGSSITAPSVLSPSLKTLGGKVLIPAVVDQVQGQALAAMQVLKEISRLQYELEVQRKALALARSWAEDEVKRAQEQVKVLEELKGKFK